MRRLIELSRALPVAKVPLTAIRELDEAYWSGEPGSRMTCRELVGHARLIAECDLAHPVILSADGRVMDGMHRICRALLEGQETIGAVRFCEDPAPDYVGVAPDELPYEDQAGQRQQRDQSCTT